MTAEIAVMNRAGIALAADSAVTVTFGSRSPKIYSTNKLFMLSKRYPVGIMIFGNANLMGIPWEIIIKEYRKKHLAENSYPKLVDYGSDFIKFLNKNTFFFTDEVQKLNLLFLFDRELRLILKKYEESLFERLADVKDANDKQEISDAVQSTFDSVVEERLEELKRLDNLGTFKITKNRFNQVYSSWIDYLVEKIPDKYRIRYGAEVTEDLKPLIKQILYLAVVKNTFENNSSTSGIVIAGYGEKEIYPSLNAYDIEIVVDDKLKFLETKNIAIDIINDSYVEPFAQDDMVQTFMRGVSPNYEYLVDTLIEDFVNKYPEAVADKITQTLPKAGITDEQRNSFVEQLKEIGKGFLKDFQDGTKEWVEKNNKSQIEIAVAMLPIDELASMAAALVNLTSQKRRYTPDEETVGGAVDVAVITKGDGFIWIDRKHYFEREKNPHFFANYYEGESENEKQQSKNGNTRQGIKTK
ncbi:MAG TPA: hypothetical protein VF604_05960 [Pyrinomonadaceae bacterium]